MKLSVVNVFEVAVLLVFFIVESQSLSRCYFIRDDNAGFGCSGGCKNVVRCTPNYANVSDDNFIETIVRTCPAGTLCNPVTHDCTGDYCDDDGYFAQSLTCAETGIFPHPWNCYQYLTCNVTISSSPTITTCGKDTAYDAQTQNCTNGAVNGRPCKDTFTVELCKNNIEAIGAYEEDPRIFYICTYNSGGYILPQFRMCREGFYFDNGAKGCVNTSSGVLHTVSSITFWTLIGYMILK